VISVISSVLVISLVNSVDLPIILLPLGPLAPRLQKLSPSFRSLYAHISDCEQFGHHLGLFHGDLLHSLDIANPVVKSVDNLDV
jgi:hypothetical protein